MGGGGESGALLARWLLEAHAIAAVDGGSFGEGGQGHIRMAYSCSREECAVGVDRLLVARLRDVRSQLSRSANVPAYVVASNRSLEEMSAKKPTTVDGLLEISGMGPTKVHLYGDALLAVIRLYCSEDH